MVQTCVHMLERARSPQRDFQLSSTGFLVPALYQSDSSLLFGPRDRGQKGVDSCTFYTPRRRWYVKSRKRPNVSYCPCVRSCSSSPPPSSSTSSTSTTLNDTEVRKPLQRRFETYVWRGYNINYRDTGIESGRPVLLIHGFGASINHWRKNIPSLESTEQLRVFAIDLIGLGASDKVRPSEVTYSIELWSDLVGDFINETKVTAEDSRWTLIGNSIGSLVSLQVASKLGRSKIRSCALMNCAGGMVSFRYSELTWFQALLYRLFNLLLFNKIVGRWVFNYVRQPNVLTSILGQVYVDKTAVDDTLVEIIGSPAGDEGACDVFLAIINGDAGPRPEELLREIEWCPILVLWGKNDPWTPLNSGAHPGSKFPDYHSGLILKTFENTGHCLHDEYPDLVNRELVPFVLNPRRRDDA